MRLQPIKVPPNLHIHATIKGALPMTATMISPSKAGLSRNVELLPIPDRN
jgi:hypothetical protein